MGLFGFKKESKKSNRKDRNIHFSTAARSNYKKLLDRSIRNGNVVITDDVLNDRQICTMAIAGILYLNSIGGGTINIISNGGKIILAFSIIDCLRTCAGNFKLICNSNASGASFMILASGKIGSRIVSKSSRLTIEPMEWEDENKDEFIPEKAFLDVMGCFVGNKTLSKIDLEIWIEDGMELTAADALGYGLIDYIYDEEVAN